jgi:hypothetical protein
MLAERKDCPGEGTESPMEVRTELMRLQREGGHIPLHRERRMRSLHSQGPSFLHTVPAAVQDSLGHSLGNRLDP